MQQLLKKLTVKGIMGAKVDELSQIEALLAAKNEKTVVPLCRIYGRTDKAKPDTSKLGDFVRFGGEFIGVNLVNGEQHRSGSAILPGVAESNIYGSMGPFNDRGQSEKVIEFAFEIGAKYDKTAATKYVYVVTPLVEPKDSDPMKALMEGAGTPKLADKSKK
jgi:hypothetical protein